MTKTNKKNTIILSLIFSGLLIGATALNQHKINKVEKNINTKIENSEDSIKELLDTREKQIITMIEGGYTDNEVIKSLLTELNEKKQELEETSKTSTFEEPKTNNVPNIIYSTPKSTNYTVKKGDTLSQILFAQYGDYYLSGIKAVAKINNIKDINNLNIGEVLEIPSLKSVMEMQNDGSLNNVNVANWVKKETVSTPTTTTDAKEEVVEETIPTATTDAKEEVVEETIPTTTTDAKEEVVEETTPTTTTDAKEEVVEETTPTATTDAKEEVVVEETIPTATTDVKEVVEETTPTATTDVKEVVVEETIPTATTDAKEEVVEELVELETLPEINENEQNEKDYNYLMEDENEDEIVNEIMSDEEFVSEMLDEPELEVLDDSQPEEISETEDTTTVNDNEESPYNNPDFQSSMFNDEYFNSLDWHLNFDNIIPPKEEDSSTDTEEFNEKKGFANEELDEYEYEDLDENYDDSSDIPTEEDEGPIDTENTTFDVLDMIVAYGANER